MIKLLYPRLLDGNSISLQLSFMFECVLKTHPIGTIKLTTLQRISWVARSQINPEIEILSSNDNPKIEKITQ